MKNIVLLFATFLFISCSSDDDAGNVITNEFEQIEITLPQHDWVVSDFTINGESHAIEFESFTFHFKADETVEAQNDLYTETGTWNYKSTAENGEQLVIRFLPATPPFDKISKDWTIVSLSISTIELSFVNSNQEIELLTFSAL